VPTGLTFTAKSLDAATLRRALIARRHHPNAAALFGFDGGAVLFTRPPLCDCRELRSLLDDWLRAAPSVLPAAPLPLLDLVERTAIALLNLPPCRWQ